MNVSESPERPAVSAQQISGTIIVDGTEAQHRSLNEDGGLPLKSRAAQGRRLARKIAYAFIVLVALFAAVPVTPAHAQAARTWVSGVGDDAQPCSRTAPCKTFAGAISKTAPAGEINVLDPGGFGAVTITKSITIRADHVEAGVLVAATNGIVVNAGPNDIVVLEGLDIEGFGSGIHGVNVLAGKQVSIVRCSIRHFTQNGINMTSNTPGGRLFLNDSYIAFNLGGVNVAGALNVSALIVNTQLLSNTAFAVQAVGQSNVVAIQTSVLNGSPVGISLLNGAGAISIGPSNQVTGTGAFTSTLPFK
jgi:hypothetical protein